MICVPCRQHRHEDCPGGSWCDCQHQEAQRPPEPEVAWIRQG